MAEESRSEGTIGLRLYLQYLTAGAHWLLLLSLIPLNLLAHVSTASRPEGLRRGRHICHPFPTGRFDSVFQPRCAFLTCSLSVCLCVFLCA